MATKSRAAAEVTVQVTRSFATLAEGERYTVEHDEWVERHVAAGVLKVVTAGGPDADQAG